MDMKSVILNGYINEEVYVSQPHGFENYEYPNHVLKLKRVLYSLKKKPLVLGMSDLVSSYLIKDTIEGR